VSGEEINALVREAEEVIVVHHKMLDVIVHLNGLPRDGLRKLRQRIADYGTYRTIEPRDKQATICFRQMIDRYLD
jgi:hypothetical protein